MKRLLLLTFATFLLLALSGVTQAALEPSPQEAIPPYTGVIQNKTNHDISFTSENSGGTLIVPARGWIEYTVWKPNVNLIGYLNGKPYFCEKVRVNPQSYPFMCKKYDFVAEIVKAEPAPKAKKAVRKKRPLRKKPVGAEVEGLG